MRRNVPSRVLTLLLACFLLTIAKGQERMPVMNEEAVSKSSAARSKIVVQKAQKIVQRSAARELNLPLESDIRGNNNTGSTGASFFTQSETSIIAFGNNVVIGFNDAGSNAAGNKFTGWSYSSDGGATFTDGGTLPNTANGDAGDPVLARDNVSGRIYFSTLQFSGSGIQMWRSDNNGVSWLPPVQAAPGKTGFQDKQWHTVDNFPGPGQGNVYHIVRDFGSPGGIFFFRSTDNGATFGPNGGLLIASPGGGNVQGAFVTVSPDHSIHAFYFDDVTNEIKVRKSTDLGLTFGAPVTIVSGLPAATNGNLGLTGIRQGTATPASFRTNTFPHVAVNPVSGHLYLTYNNDAPGADRADVFVVQSTDGGATWSAPFRVNDDATATDQWQPTIAVMPDGLQVGVFYYSRQEDAANNNLFKYYGRIARINGTALNWAASFAVSDAASLPEFGRDGVVNPAYMGDYDQTATTPGIFHVVWADNRDDLPSGGGRKDPNVYYEKILSPSTIPGKNISVVPTSINFGEVAVGQPAPQAQIVISNIGDEPLTINSITAPSGDFSLTGLPSFPTVIPVGDYIIIYAQFNPSSAGIKTASFNINSDAINTPSVVVNLQGEGVAPPTNDACSNAIALSCGSSVTGRTTFASPDGAPSCNAVTNTGKGIWYTIAGTGYPITASLCTGTFFDTKVSVYSGSCASLSCVDANDNFCNTQSQVTWNSVVGTTYYILVHGTAAGNFTLNINCPPIITVTPSPLVINVPYGSTGSGNLNIANAPGSQNLNWIINDLSQPYAASTSNDPGGPVFNWVDITATGTQLSTLSDDASISVPLPFTFSFFGEDKTEVFVSSNGFLTFRTQGSTVFNNTGIPVTNSPNDLLAVFWDDLNPTLGGTIHYHSSPAQFVVQYTNIRPFSGPGAYTFQVILNADGTIVYQYLNMTGTLTGATVGIENVTGTQGIQSAFNQPFVQNNLAVRYSFRPPSVCTWITSIYPFIGTTPGGTSSNVTLGVDATGLNCGTYNCDITINSNAANTPALVVPVVLNVQPAFTCSVASVPTNNTYTGGVPTNLYIGYGPQSTTLQTTVSGLGGPFTYSWTPATGLSSTTSAAPVFTPTAPGEYTFTVTVTGAGLCATTCSITINVYDVRVPGSKGKKVFLCHTPNGNPGNARTLEVSVNAVPDHLLNHPGDRLGTCGQVQNLRTLPPHLIENSEPVGLSNAYPNPTTGRFTVKLPNNNLDRLEVRVLNKSGVVAERRWVNNRGEGQTIQFDLTNKAAGVYLIQFIGKDGTQTIKVAVVR